MGLVLTHRTLFYINLNRTTSQTSLGLSYTYPNKKASPLERPESLTF